MIVDGILLFLVRVFAEVFNKLLPHLSLGTIPSISTTYMLEVGHFLRFMTPVIPATLVVAWITIFGVLLLVRGGYIVFQWLWDHWPSIAGFGTH